MKIDIASYTQEEIKALMLEWKEPSFRAKQIYEWIHQKLASSFEEMSNLPVALRSRLIQEASLPTMELANLQESLVDGTRKYLFCLEDKHLVESVFMKYKHGNSVCISSQVGCRMGCKFCASTLDGLQRNLSAAEMLAQIYAIRRHTGERVSNVVVMGMGEPLDNYDALIRFVYLLSGAGGLTISQRNITISTCGIVPGIHRLSKEGLSITLALSLHACNDQKRQELMPIARKYSLEEVLEACDEYFLQTGRRVSYEYSLVGGVNDTAEDAQGLVQLLKGKNCHVNLIPVNPIKERQYRESNQQQIAAFKNKLEKCGINVTIRREMGRDIDGACGQLRSRYQKENVISEESKC